jgi:hypothetical protein
LGNPRKKFATRACTSTLRFHEGILRKHGYPPDKQQKVTQTGVQQAELLCGDWAG